MAFEEALLPDNAAGRGEGPELPADAALSAECGALATSVGLGVRPEARNMPQDAALAADGVALAASVGLGLGFGLYPLV